MAKNNDGYLEAVILVSKAALVVVFGTIIAIAMYFLKERGILRLWSRSK
jgi:hypothetical protein